MPMPFAHVLVVIPTLNEARHIESVLRDLHRDLPADVQTDFVVCDGGSTDSTFAIVQRLQAEMPRLHWLHNPKRRQAAAVNLAVERFGDLADVLIRCDAHAGYPPGYVARLVESLERHDADAVVVPMDSVGESGLQKVVGWVSNCWIGTGGSAHRAGQVSGFVDHGHHAAFRMAGFRRVGGYDESFTHNEDAELDCRQRALGLRIFLDAGIRITYHPRGSLSALWCQYMAYGRGRSRTVRRHPGSWRLRQMVLPVHAVLLAASLAASAVTPWALAWPLTYASVLAVQSLWLAVRERSAAGLLAAPVAATMHVGWAFGFLHGLVSMRERPWVRAGQKPTRGVTSSSKVPA
jgi:succinoglycan biosynthesis protein ExoA